VPTHTRRATGSPSAVASRSRIWRAASFMNATAQISSGRARPLVMSQAIRAVRTRVLPVPAPAITSSTPPG